MLFATTVSAPPLHDTVKGLPIVTAVTVSGKICVRNRNVLNYSAIILGLIRNTSQKNRFQVGIQLICVKTSCIKLKQSYKYTLLVMETRQ